MNKTYKDTDLREALRRKYSDTPQLPADFMAKMEERLDAKPVAKTRRLWTWIAAAACFLLIIGIGITTMKDRATQPAQKIAATVEEPQSQGQSEQSRGQARGAEPSEPVPVTAPVTVSIPSKPSTHVARTSPAKPQTDTASAAENLAYYIARLEAEMENLDDSVSSARVEQLIAADVRLQQLVNRIVGKQVEQAVNELKKDSTAQYINF